MIMNTTNNIDDIPIGYLVRTEQGDWLLEMGWRKPIRWEV